MDSRTERLIRRDIQLRWAPISILLWLFIGSVVGLGLIGGLGLLDHFLRTHGF